MGIERKIRKMLLGVALLPGAAPAIAASPEPLIVTQLADPDPNYVPPPDGTHGTRRSSDLVDDNVTLDQAMQDFGRAIGQAAMLQQQAIEARCRSAEAVPAGGAGRMAWEANCRYQRH